MQNFSEVVRATMTRKNLKVADIAHETGYTWQYINDLLRNKRRWNETTIAKVCGALNLEIEYKEKVS